MDSLPAIVKYVRFERAGVERYGIWEGDLVKELYGSPLSGVRETGREFLRSETRLLVPCLPSKVLGVGLNYASHREHVEGSEGVILNASGRPVPSHYPASLPSSPRASSPTETRSCCPTTQRTCTSRASSSSS